MSSATTPDSEANLIAKRALAIKESPTMAVVARAEALKRQGEDVIALAAGEPDFPTPKHIKEAAIAAINTDKTHYTAVSGVMELRQAICAKLWRENQLQYNERQIIVSCGAKHAIYNALQAIINDGDEVIIPAPYWVSYPDMTILAGGVPVVCAPENNLKLTAAKLCQALTAKSKVLILNSPNNPTGMVYSKEELVDLAQVLRNYPQVTIITDDIYEHILFGQNPKFYNIANVAPDLLARTIVINGVSKAYAMTGWRIGYAACTNPLIISAMTKIQSQATTNACTIAQYAAIAALNGNDADLKIMSAEFSKRHDYLLQRLSKMPYIKYTPAEGAFYLFCDCTLAIKALYEKGVIQEESDMAFANYLLDQHKLALVPGSAFGFHGCMRLSFATSMAILQTAMDRLEASLVL